MSLLGRLLLFTKWIFLLGGRHWEDQTQNFSEDDRPRQKVPDWQNNPKGVSNLTKYQKKCGGGKRENNVVYSGHYHRCQ